MLSRVGKFQILSRLGQGGMGSVYLALDTALNRQVALKLIHPASADAEEARKRFRREAQTAAQLHHPNLVTIFEFGEEEAGLFLVMEYLEGVDLESALAQRLLSDHQAVEVMAKVLDGLAQAHAKGIVHRDIKPSNIRLFQDGGHLGAKVLDFGIARLRHDALLTGSGMVLGTPYYTAPEVLRGGEPDPRVDLWSVGVILFEVLTGHRPFEASTPAGIHFKIAFEPLPPLESPAETELRRGLERVVARALAKEPEARFSGAEALAAALRALPGFDPHLARQPLPLASPAPADGEAPTQPVGLTPPPAPPRARDRAPLPDSAPFDLPPPPPSPLERLRQAALGGDLEAANALGLKYLLGEGFLRDSTTAAQWFRQAAEGGLPSGAYNLGCLLLLGDGVPAEADQALRWFRLAAEGGLPEAMVALGRNLLDTQRAEGVAWLRRGAEAGSPEAICQLAKALADEALEGESRIWFEKAADLGIPEAMMALGRAAEDAEAALAWFAKAEAMGFQDAALEAGLRCLDLGRPEAGAQWLRKASWKGSIEAMYRLALMELHGEGIPQNLREAMTYLRQAGEQGHQDAMFLRARLLMSGEAGRPDPSSALDLWSHLSRMGHPGAQLELGRALMAGDGVAPDPAQALALFKAAAEAGSGAAAFEVWEALQASDPLLALRYLRQAAEQGLPEATGALGLRLWESRPEEAFPWLKRGAEGGHVEAMALVGEAYCSGRGTAVQKLEALRWFRAAAKGGHRGAAGRAARMLDKGDGVLPDKQEARYWAERSGDKGGLLSVFRLKL